MTHGVYIDIARMCVSGIASYVQFFIVFIGTLWMWMWILNLYSAISWSISIALSTLVFRKKYSLQTTPKAAAAERWITETVR